MSTVPGTIEPEPAVKVKLPAKMGELDSRNIKVRNVSFISLLREIVIRTDKTITPKLLGVW
jgi:hypothetical protein